MQDTLWIALALTTGFGITQILQKPVYIMAGKIGAISRPRDDRWSHPAPIPRLGGLAFAIPVLCWCIVSGSLSIAISVLLVTSLGLIDDAKELMAAPKFIGQLLSVLPIALTAGSVLSGCEIALWLLILVNAANMFDNMDGSLGLVASLALVTYAIMLGIAGSSVALLAITLASGLIAFLRTNWHPAKAFMGDTGSMLVGLVLGVCTIELRTYALSLPIITLPMGLILLDFAAVCLLRTIAGVPVWVGGKDHLTHRLARVGFEPRSIAAGLTFVTTALCVAALIL